jgi:hypothetical protein
MEPASDTLFVPVSSVASVKRILARGNVVGVPARQRRPPPRKSRIGPLPAAGSGNSSHLVFEKHGAGTEFVPVSRSVPFPVFTIFPPR